MATKAYVLVKCDGSILPQAVKAIRQTPAVLVADAVMGSYDIIVILQAADTEDIANIVLSDIDTVPGVMDTTTYLAVSLD
ncbi:MAG: Lrp/AsnC ligand binding domain-containing protein [Dehalococcoidia bacterium]|nr:Lrp/AsnC ligand binding domain-containing protein [Dehalococcoidia bacterium]